MNEHVKTMLELSSTAGQRKLTGEELDTLNGIMTATNGLEETLGVRYTEVAPHSLTLRLEVQPIHLQPWGITNGGIYATLGETAASMASFVAAGAGPIVVGTNNNTDFLRPSKVGDVIVSTATAEHLGSTSHLWRVEHRNEETGKMLALTMLKTAVMNKR